jgi:hypothetical protein
MHGRNTSLGFSCGLRAAPKEDSAVSSAEIVFGAPLTLPGQFLPEDSAAVTGPAQVSHQNGGLPTRPLTYAQAAATPRPALMAARFVYVRRSSTAPPLTPLYQGPFRVVRAGPKFFKLQIGGKEESVSVDLSVDRLKPHTGGGEVTPAQPSRQGRPHLAAAATTSSPVSAAGSTPTSSTVGGSCSGTNLGVVWSNKCTK